MDYYNDTVMGRERHADFIREAEHQRLVLRALGGSEQSPAVRLGWGGLSLAAAGLLFITASVVNPTYAAVPAGVAANSGRWVLGHGVLLAAVLLAFWGLVRLHLAQRESSGALGAAAVGLTLVGTVMQAGFLFAEAFVFPGIAAGERSAFGASQLTPALLIAAGSFYLGYLLVALATMRAAKLPRHAGLVLSIGAPLSILARTLLPNSVAPELAALVFGAGLVVLGYVTWRRAAILARQQPVPVRVRA